MAKKYTLCTFNHIPDSEGYFQKLKSSTHNLTIKEGAGEISRLNSMSKVGKIQFCKNMQNWPLHLVVRLLERVQFSAK